jgi:uncharacterized protein
MSVSHHPESEDPFQTAVHHAAHLLPAQGPIGVFIHHNTLHAFEHLTFEEAVVEAGKVYNCQPFMSAEWFRQEYSRGRIKDVDIKAIIEAETPQESRIAETVSWRAFKTALLLYPIHEVEGAGLRWHLNETGALWRFRQEVDHSTRDRLKSDILEWLQNAPERLTERVGALPDEWDQQSLQQLIKSNPAKVAVRALWTTCRRVTHKANLDRFQSVPKTLVRHRDFLYFGGLGDCDALVHPFLIRFCGAYLDQGLAEQNMPGRQEGLFQNFLALYGEASGILPYWLQGARNVLNDLSHRNLSGTESAKESLALLGVKPEQFQQYLLETSLALKGWAGMIHQSHERPDRLNLEVVPASLTDFLAIRLILERFALQWLLSNSGRQAKLNEIPEIFGQPPVPPVSVDSWAFQLFQVAQFLALTPKQILEWTPEQTDEILGAIYEFDDLERRRLLHLAYERRFKAITLDALALHHVNQPVAPKFQAIFCIDEREESTRRHLEEVAPECETFGTLGFFAVPMYFKAVHEPHPVALCPAVIRPRHLVREVANPSKEQEAARQANFRRSLGKVELGVHRGSHTLTLGGILNSGLGLITASPALFRVLFPWRAGQMQRSLRKRLLPSDTRLLIERDPTEPTDKDGILLGFSVEEMADIVALMLENIGLIKDFAPLVLVMGHGSSSLNNPHEAAHDCGACGGGRGGPNARSFAWMANHKPVRQLLAQRGLVLPEQTQFVGAYHNTCDDEVDLYDLQDLSETHMNALEKAIVALNEARARDAQERCRRFDSASFELSPRAALVHVEERAEDLAQPRPEYGHATNASCIMGRRSRTRGLFLDRRAFLVSYDPTQDDDQGTILGRQLRSVVPVGAGISLEYYFSFVDNAGYGCGTKLPHNITGMLGVMDGHSSDLRTGLPLQMVEIHEPVRLLAVIETKKSVIEAIVGREEAVRRLVSNRWVQIALLDPDSQEISVLEVSCPAKGTNQGGSITGWTTYVPEVSRLPHVSHSFEWFHKHSEHLEFAEVEETKPQVREEAGRC